MIRAEDVKFFGPRSRERRERWLSACWRDGRVFFALSSRGSGVLVELDLDPVGGLLTPSGFDALAKLFRAYSARGTMGRSAARMRAGREHAEALAAELCEFFEDPERIERHEMIA
jgi:hypothetical protein